MEEYNRPGAFGKVAFFRCCSPGNRFRALDTVSHAGWHRVNDLYRIHRPKGTASALILLTREGRGFVRVGQKKYAALPGTAMVIPPGVPHAYGAEAGQTWDFYWLHFFGGFSLAAVQDAVRDDAHCFSLGEHRIEALFRPFTEGFCAPGREVEQSEALHRLLFALLKQSLPKPTPEEQAKTDEMIAFVEEQTDGFSLEKMSERFHYSKEYLIRRFKAATGSSPYRYWRICRLQNSRADLEAGKMSVEQIAAKYGYASAGSYAKQFKKLFSLSPEEYRDLLFARN